MNHIAYGNTSHHEIHHFTQLFVGIIIFLHFLKIMEKYHIALYNTAIKCRKLTSEH